MWASVTFFFRTLSDCERINSCQRAFLCGACCQVEKSDTRDGAVSGQLYRVGASYSKKRVFICFSLIYFMKPILFMKTQQCKAFHFAVWQQSLSFVGATKSGDSYLLRLEEKPSSSVCWWSQFRLGQFWKGKADVVSILWCPSLQLLFSVKTNTPPSILLHTFNMSLLLGCICRERDTPDVEYRQLSSAAWFAKLCLNQALGCCVSEKGALHYNRIFGSCWPG